MTHVKTFAIVCALVVTVVTAYTTNGVPSYTTDNGGIIIEAGAYGTQDDTDQIGVGVTGCTTTPLAEYTGWPFTAHKKTLDCNGGNGAELVYPVGIALNSVSGVTLGIITYLTINSIRRSNI